MYKKTFTEASAHENTATIRETGQFDKVKVTANVYSSDVSKDTVTSFNRNWSWSNALILFPSKKANSAANQWLTDERFDLIQPNLPSV